MRVTRLNSPSSPKDGDLDDVAGSVLEVRFLAAGVSEASAGVSLLVTSVLGPPCSSWVLTS